MAAAVHQSAAARIRTPEKKINAEKSKPMFSMLLESAKRVQNDSLADEVERVNIQRSATTGP